MVAPQSLNSFFSFLTSRMYTLNAHCYFLNHRPWALTMYSAPVTINICSSCLRNFICLQYPKFSIAAVLIIYTLLFPELFLEQGFSSLEDSLWLGSATHKTLQWFLEQTLLKYQQRNGSVSILGNYPLLWTKVVIPLDFLPTIIRCLSEGE